MKQKKRLVRNDLWLSHIPCFVVRAAVLVMRAVVGLIVDCLMFAVDLIVDCLMFAVDLIVDCLMFAVVSARKTILYCIKYNIITNAY